jgi:PAS domain S-box-containing protein
MDMHSDMPITRREYDDLRDEELICSKTDAEGIITYANTALCRISGFSETELLGHPHNIMRHPDMPGAVYAWMWDRLNRGRLWRAMVKNRCRNGDHYWADTNISQQYAPDGRIIGYLSTRRVPNSTQIAEAEALYAPLRQAEEEQTQHGRLTPEHMLELYRSSPLYQAH